MAPWNPQRLRKERRLSLSQDERQQILSKLPIAEDGWRYADAVFEGGGIRGLAFLGALRCFSDLGIRWKNLAGSSAGALTAAFVAAGFSVDELEQALGELNFMDFLREKSSPLILNNDPADDLNNPIWMISNLQLLGQLGQYSSAPLKQWLQTFLGKRVKTFADIQARGRRLKVIVSDVSRGQMLVLPDDLKPFALDQNLHPRQILQELEIQLPPDFSIARPDKTLFFNQAVQHFSVAEAIRLSISIPFFFQPGKLLNSTIVDGGILSNFPLWIYDVEPQIGQPIALPRHPTFGFRLLDTDAEAISESTTSSTPNTAVDLFIAIMKAMHSARDDYHLRNNDQGRVINIKINNISATQFTLSNHDKDELYATGYESAKTFLLEEWDWQKHLAIRGFHPYVDRYASRQSTPIQSLYR